MYVIDIVTIHTHAHLMRPTSHFLQHTARITLFTRSNCELCKTAKSVLGNLGKKRSFEYNEVDVMATGQKQWKDLYEFDTPVVSNVDPLSDCLTDIVCRFTFSASFIHIQSLTSLPQLESLCIASLKTRSSF